MAVNTNSMLDALAILVQAIAHDTKLLRWFETLNQKSAAERRNKIYSMADQMTKDRKEANLICSLKLLANPEIFNAAREALRENGHISD